MTTSTDTTTPTPAGSTPADPIIELPAWHLACRCCGIAIPRDETTVQRITSLGREGQPVMPGIPNRLPEIELGRCTECRARHDLAADLVRRYPTAFASMGSPDIAADRLAFAADALAVIGRASSLTEDPPEQLRSAIRRLAEVGAGASWAARFAPVWGRGVSAATCAAAPWAHVGTAVRRNAVRGFSGLLAERVAVDRPDVDLSPPTGQACVLCGVGAVTVSALDIARRDGIEHTRAHVWTHLDAPARAFGGPRGSARITGYTCPACTAAREFVGALGPTVIERAVSQHVLHRGGENARWTAWRVRDGQLRLMPWALLQPSSRPNAEPWQHLRLIDPAGPRD